MSSVDKPKSFSEANSSSSAENSPIASINAASEAAVFNSSIFSSVLSSNTLRSFSSA